MTNIIEQEIEAYKLIRRGINELIRLREATQAEPPVELPTPQPGTKPIRLIGYADLGDIANGASKHLNTLLESVGDLFECWNSYFGEGEDSLLRDVLDKGWDIQLGTLRPNTHYERKKQGKFDTQQLFQMLAGTPIAAITLDDADIEKNNYNQAYIGDVVRWRDTYLPDVPIYASTTAQIALPDWFVQQVDAVMPQNYLGRSEYPTWILLGALNWRKRGYHRRYIPTIGLHIAGDYRPSPDRFLIECLWALATQPDDLAIYTLFQFQGNSLVTDITQLPDHLKALETLRALVNYWNDMGLNQPPIEPYALHDNGNPRNEQVLRWQTSEDRMTVLLLNGDIKSTVDIAVPAFEGATRMTTLWASEDSQPLKMENHQLRGQLKPNTAQLVELS